MFTCLISKYRFILISLILSFYFSTENKNITFKNLFLSKPSSVDYSLGLNEKLCYYGFYTVSYNNKINENLTTFKTLGTSLLFGAAGFGVSKRFNNIINRLNIDNDVITPFITTTILSTYTLPMCSTNDCKPSLSLLSTNSIGLRIQLINHNNFNLDIKLGVLVGLDLINGSFLESPSDKPSFWPSLNLVIR